MKQLILESSGDDLNVIHNAVDKHGGKNSIVLNNSNPTVVMCYVPNRKINDLLQDLSALDNLKISLQTTGSIVLYPPENQEPDKTADVLPKSSFEIYLQGIQSVGSWFGMLGYSIASGIIVWIGLYTNISYLLVAAMLVAPYAGPAMNAAIATASGRRGLLLKSIGRYAGSVATGVMASLVLSIFFPIQTYTPLMTTVSQISSVALLLPLTAGFAGGINICQSSRDSLVSGAAVGILVAASLAPPIGLLGMGIYMLDSGLILSSIFRIVLQLMGIHLAATMVFYYYGKLDHKGTRFINGSAKLRMIVLLIITLGIASMMFWQFREDPYFRKSSLKTELTEKTEKLITEMGTVKMVKSDISFSSKSQKDKPMINFSLTLLPLDRSTSEAEIKTEIIRRIKQEVDYGEMNIFPVFDIKVVEQ